MATILDTHSRSFFFNFEVQSRPTLIREELISLFLYLLKEKDYTVGLQSELHSNIHIAVRNNFFSVWSFVLSCYSKIFVFCRSSVVVF